MVGKISGESVLNISSNGRQGLHGTNETEDMTFGHSRRIRITSLTSNLVYGPISPGYKLRVWNTIFFPLPSPPPFLSARKVSNLRSNPPLPVYTFSHSLFPFPRFHYWRDGKIKFHDSYTCTPLIIGKDGSFSRWRSFFLSIYIDFSLFQ